MPHPTHPPSSSVATASSKEQLRKKRKAVISTPSPTSDRVGDDDAAANDVLALPTLPISDAPPEILRQQGQVHFDLHVSNRQH